MTAFTCWNGRANLANSKYRIRILNIIQAKIWFRRFLIAILRTMHKSSFYANLLRKCLNRMTGVNISTCHSGPESAYRLIGKLSWIMISLNTTKWIIVICHRHHTCWSRLTFRNWTPSSSRRRRISRWSNPLFLYLYQRAKSPKCQGSWRSWRCWSQGHDRRSFHKINTALLV